jgi:sugar lactone lactonase YvrE
MLAGDILSLASDGSVGRNHAGGIAAAVRPRVGGGAVIGIERGFALEEPDGTIRALPPLWNGESVRMNEGACDPDGRFYCGSMAYDQRPGGAALYCLDPDGDVRTVLDAVTVSNGLDWSPDGTLAYYNDTATRQVSVFGYDAQRGLGERRVFAEVDGRPDGLTVDAEAGVWIAISDRGQVWRLTAGGAVDAVIDIPAGKVTACTFGGAGLRKLFVTTSREGLTAGEDPQAGSLFCVEPGVAGKPVLEFAG